MANFSSEQNNQHFQPTKDQYVTSNMLDYRALPKITSEATLQSYKPTVSLRND